MVFIYQEKKKACPYKDLSISLLKMVKNTSVQHLVTRQQDVRCCSVLKHDLLCSSVESQKHQLMKGGTVGYPASSSLLKFRLFF